MNRKKLFAAMMAFTMACTGGVASMSGALVNVQAASFNTFNTESGIADLGDGTASITIQGNAGQSLVGKQFNVYKLFDAANASNGESINYTMNVAYKTALQNVVGAALSKTPASVTEYEIIDYIQSLNTNEVAGAQTEQTPEGSYSDFRYFVDDLRDELVSLGCDCDTITVNTVSGSNSVKLSGLEYGYYLIDEVTSVAGENAASSLCMVNTVNPTAEINIKSDFPDNPEKKVQEDDNKNEIGNNGWNDVADFEIGQTVPFEYSSTIPNMNGYETYYYAWNDRMSEALTFDKDSVEIVISNGSKEYTLAESEFTVVENPDQDTTFKVAIADIKAIVDREFPDFDEYGHNTYGQTVTVTYDAKLNDKAVDYTGRPGIENDVRLEYSNDPDSESRGFTPWDTVIVFTYKLDGVKTNDAGEVLQDAKFRLFSDEACTEEVYVKKTDKGYIVINRDSVGGDDHTGGTVPADAVEMVSDENGNFAIYGLDTGVYYLKEEAAPDGYRLLLDPIKLDVVATYTEKRNDYVKGDGATDKTLKALDITASIEEVTNALVTDVEEGSGNLTVINHVGSKLPVTGSAGVLGLMAVGIPAMIGAVKLNKKKNEDDK